MDDRATELEAENRRLRAELARMTEVVAYERERNRVLQRVIERLLLSGGSSHVPL